jgi:hypothetical protein
VPTPFSGFINLRKSETDRQQPVLLAHRPGAGKAEPLAQPQHGLEALDRAPRCVECYAVTAPLSCYRVTDGDVMRKSGAQRQAEYRQRHLKDETGTLERINLLVSIAAKRQLERPAYCYDVTQRAMLEKLLAEAERATLAALSPEAQGDYLDKRRPLCSNEPAPPCET